MNTYIYQMVYFSPNFCRKKRQGTPNFPNTDQNKLDCNNDHYSRIISFKAYFST